MRKILKNARFTGDGKINKWGAFFLTFPNLPATLTNVIIHNAFIKYYTDIIGLRVEYTAVIWIIFGIWNAINDPVLGVMIDRKKYDEKKGKLLYLMRVTVPLMSISSLVMIYAQPAWGDLFKFLFLLVFLFIYDTAYTIFNVSHMSFKFLAAPRSEDRTNMAVFNVWLSNIGGLLATIVPTMLLVGDAQSSTTVLIFTVVTGLSAVFYLLALIPLKETQQMYLNENEQLDEREGLVVDILVNLKTAWNSRSFRSYALFQMISLGANAIYFTTFLFLADDVWNFNGIEATIVDVIPGVVLLLASIYIGKFIKKKGSKKSILIGVVPLAISFTLLFWVKNMYTALIVYICIRIFANMLTINIHPIIGAIIDEDEICTGQRRAGMYNGILQLLSVPAIALQTAIFLYIIGQFGYVEAVGTQLVEQSEQVKLGIRLAASFLPAVFILLGATPMLFYPIDLKSERLISNIMIAKFDTDNPDEFEKLKEQYKKGQKSFNKEYIA